MWRNRKLGVCHGRVDKDVMHVDSEFCEVEDAKNMDKS